MEQLTRQLSFDSDRIGVGDAVCQDCGFKWTAVVNIDDYEAGGGYLACYGCGSVAAVIEHFR